GNVTGVSFLVNLTMTKELELLSELVPSAGIIGLLVNSANPNIANDTAQAQKAAVTLGRTLIIVKADTNPSLQTAFAALAGENVGAIVVAPDPFFLATREHIVALAAQHRLAAIYFFREFALVGGLISYG